MTNQFPPRVTIEDTSVELGRQFLFRNSISVEDLDPDSTVVRYRFRDNNATASSGFFVFQGERVDANIWFTVEASELNQLFYRAGLVISAESVGAQAFDGQFWSEGAFGIVATTSVNDMAPTVSLSNFNVLATEPIRIDQFIEASDANGDLIETYWLVDRRSNDNGGFFTVGGVRQESAVWFSVSADELSTVRYFGGTFGQTENIGVRVSDGRFLSSVDQGLARTLANRFQPEVTAFDVSIALNRQTSLANMFGFDDQDGNSAKFYNIIDTGSNPQSGAFFRNGVELAANTTHRVLASELNTISYRASAIPTLENFRIQAFDGRFLSSFSTATVSSIQRPNVTFNSVLSLNDFEFVSFTDLVQETPGAPPAFVWEIIDLNESNISADLVLNGQTLEAGRVHTLTALQLDNLQIRGGSSADAGRIFDQFVFRSSNGTFGDWRRLDVDTTDVAEDALLDFGRWEDTNLTFSFPNFLPDQHVGGFAGNGFTPMNAVQRQAVREILQHLSDLTNLTFTEVSGTEGGTLEYFNAALPAGVLGVGFPPETAPSEVAGDFIITNVGNVPDPVAGNDFYEVILHELGHTVGLKHPDNQTGAGEPPLLPPSLQDSRFTVMTSIAGPPNGSSGAVFNRTFQLFDVLALQRLYGANPTFNNDDTQIRGEFQNDSRFHLIYDTGGYDTINRTVDTVDAVFNLNEGQYSSLGGEIDNTSILYGTRIEAARGGSGDDQFFGNELNNLLIGNDGADFFRGDGGRDVLRGLAGNDTYQWALGDGFDIINEDRGAGRDVLEIVGYAGLDDFSEDIAFRRIGRNLNINFNVDLGLSQGGITITNQEWGGSRIETLRFVDTEGEQIVPDVDLTSIFTSAVSRSQRFEVTEFAGSFGNIAVPV